MEKSSHMRENENSQIPACPLRSFVNPKDGQWVDQLCQKESCALWTGTQCAITALAKK
ncbi:MAG: hypothetical protein PVG65_03380 [Candidatus Thorarchaeota archaeon]|jgi:hypothetical protein